MIEVHRFEEWGEQQVMMALEPTPQWYLVPAASPR
jgi:hypothetical protein